MAGAVFGLQAAVLEITEHPARRIGAPSRSCSPWIDCIGDGGLVTAASTGVTSAIVGSSNPALRLGAALLAEQATAPALFAFAAAACVRLSRRHWPAAAAVVGPDAPGPSQRALPLA